MFFCKEMRAHRENARADKDHFSDKHADNVGFSQIKRVCLKNNPHYLLVM